MVMVVAVCDGSEDALSKEFFICSVVVMDLFFNAGSSFAAKRFATIWFTKLL